MFIQGPQKGTTIELGKPLVTFGRDPDSDVVLQDRRASWSHFRIERRDDDHYVVDAGSRNGTFLGDDLVPVVVAEKLHSGISLWFGDTEVEVRLKADEPTRAASALRKIDDDRTAAVDVSGLHGFMAEAEDRTREFDPSEALRMVEELERKRAAGAMPARKAAPRKGRLDDIWERAGDDSVVVEEAIADEDREAFPPNFRLRARLLFLAGPHEGREVYLGSVPTLIGRSTDCTVVLDDDLASREHARVIREQSGGYTVHDLHSANGVMINGQPIKDVAVLHHRALITVGSSILEYRAPLIDQRTEDPLKTVAMSIPLYAFQGKVLTQYELSIGRDPNSELFLEDKSVDRHHATLQWRGAEFHLRDLGERGTYVGGQRIVETTIGDGDVVDIGIYKLTVNIDGLRCSIDVLQTRPDAVEAFVADTGGKKAYRTVFRVAVPEAIRNLQNQQGMAAEQEEEGGRRSVTWVPPLETVPSWRLPLVVTTALFMVFTLGGAFAAFGGWPVQSQTLSTAHDNELFQNVAAATDSGAGCLGCHKPFQGVTDASCKACHTRKNSPSHELARKEGKKDAPSGCQSCHGEHQTREALRATLGQRCTSCHEDRHEAHGLNAPTPLPPGIKTRPDKGALKALLAAPEGTPAFAKTIAYLHDSHQAIDRRCAGCHADEKLGKQIDARGSCFRCHGDTKQLASTMCTDCHASEHPGVDKEWAAAVIGRPPRQAERAERVFASVSAVTAIGWSGLWSLLVFLPIAFVFFAHKLVSRRGRPRDPDEDVKHRDDWHDEWMVDIDPEKCIGDKACLVCPYNVIEYDEKTKQAYAKFVGACHGCRACEKRCPAKAITAYKVSEGLPSRDFPDLTPHYEVVDRPGIFLIGQVTEFKPLMKNAINLGAATVKYIVNAGVRPGTGTQHGLDHELVVVGAGPGGTSAGIEAQGAGLSVRVFEKGDNFASTHRVMMEPEKYLQANPASIQNIGSLPLFAGVKQVKDVLPMWEEAVRKSGLNIDFGQEVTKIVPHGEGFEVTTNQGVTCTTARVIVAIGGLGTPRKPRCGGANLPKVRHFLTDRSEYQNKDILVSGAGNAGLETVQALADPSLGNRVYLQYHKPWSAANASPENIKLVDELAARATNPVTILAPYNLDEITETHAILTPLDAPAPSGGAKAQNLGPCVPSAPRRRGGDAKKEAPKRDEAPAAKAEPPAPKEPITIPNDYVFACIGAILPTKWLQDIGVKFAKKPANWNPGPTDDLSFLEEK